MDGGYTVVIDTVLTPELIEEGFVNEIISKVQTMRKKADFNVMDKITLFASQNDKLCELIKRNESVIGHDCLVSEFIIGENAPVHSAEWDINGETITLGVKK
jgi:isoleucyl-tRNA synthetase